MEFFDFKILFQQSPFLAVAVGVIAFGFTRFEKFMKQIDRRFNHLDDKMDHLELTITAQLPVMKKQIQTLESVQKSHERELRDIWKVLPMHLAPKRDS